LICLLAGVITKEEVQDLLKPENYPGLNDQCIDNAVKGLS